MDDLVRAGDNPLIQLSLAELRTRTSMKWRAHPGDVLPLWVAEMDVPLAPPVLEALVAALDRGDTGYPAGTAYAEAVRRFAADRWDWPGLAVERTAVVPDVMMGIVEILRLISEPGDVVVVTPPVYPPFYAFVTHADRRVIEARLGAAGRIDHEALEAAFVRARATCSHPVFLMSNPHNPTGVVHTRTELESVAALAARHGVRVVSDEIHAPLALPGARFTPYLSVAGSDDAFALLSASKAWNLAGLKAALAVAGPAAAGDLARLPEEVSHGPSHLGVIAHTVAFGDGGPWLDRLLAGLGANRDLLGRLVAERLPGVTVTPPEGTYLAWLDCTALGLDEGSAAEGPGVVSELAGPARFFLDHARVALSSGHVFGSGGAGRVRLNFATRPDILTEAVARMAEALDRRSADLAC
ncbi:putative cystathionine beta-lyase [Nostocoides japonicum T1-X7]|uniref:cysteine-S-conjugate beta-lyase n=1 Tax=Nostocoides japonicum T1-X7 TaxID=1194083 RepID=A0A077LSS3_9MICO|nr:aminotransferase class I/II-fold pyridoxal phosphate-dependent enzyme [Tetrasphaera japonica]CCH75896.1 putative cystathionine beta-lyase [Tetrasphaera japonica T1-X7]